MMSEADFSLQNLKRIAEVLENSQRSHMLIDRSHFTHQQEVNQVNLLKPSVQNNRGKQYSNKQCLNRGQVHLSTCPTKGKVCRKCGKGNHFAKVCCAKNIAILETQETFAIDSFYFGDVNKESKWFCVFPIHICKFCLYARRDVF